MTPDPHPVEEAPPSPNGVLTQRLGSLSGARMDTPRAPRRFTPRRLAIAGGIVVVLVLVVFVLTQDRSRRLRVEVDRLTVSTVSERPFQEYVALTGTVQPIRTVLLDAVVGGQVRQRLVEEGAMVEEGQPLLVLSNDNLALQVMSSEANLAEQMTGLRNTRLALDQNALNLAQQLTELDYNLARTEREHRRLKALYDRGVVSEQDYTAARDELAYLQRRRSLTIQSHRQDSLQRILQLEQMQDQMGRLQENLGLVRQTAQNLVVRAPVAGQLTAFAAEVGELKAQGARLGQIDVLDGFRVTAAVDEHYIARVAAGQQAEADVNGQRHTLLVRRVFPEVREGRFEIELVFQGAAPAGIRRGQSLRLRLALSDPETALLLPRGGFAQTTGGHWAYVLTSDGEAVRTPLELGRQNPQFFEVLDGLRPGDRVVTSGYETFGDAEKLVLR